MQNCSNISLCNINFSKRPKQTAIKLCLCVGSKRSPKEATRSTKKCKYKGKGTYNNVMSCMLLEDQICSIFSLQALTQKKFKLIH